MTVKTLLLKQNFLIDINVEINGDIIFQTSVYDPCNKTAEVDPIEVLEPSSSNDSIEVVFEEDDPQSSTLDGDLSQNEDADLDCRRKRSSGLRMESLRRPSFRVVPAKVKYETLGKRVRVPLATPERR